MTWMLTWQQFLGDEAKDFVLRVELSEKLDPTLNTSLVNIFA
jgi:hypothetical protein